MPYYEYYDRQSAGSDFEDDTVNTLIEMHIPYPLKQVSGTHTDTHEGTDILFGNLRVDLTLNFSEKDNMPFIYDTGIPAAYGQNFMIGIRTGNKHKGYTEFNDPVVIMGADIDAYHSGYAKTEMMSNIRKHGLELVHKCMDAYDEYTTLDKEDRSYIQHHVDFTRNPHYTEPRRLGRDYRKANELQDKIINNGRNNDNMPYDYSE